MNAGCTAPRGGAFSSSSCGGCCTAQFPWPLSFQDLRIRDAASRPRRVPRLAWLVHPGTRESYLQPVQASLQQPA